MSAESYEDTIAELEGEVDRLSKRLKIVEQTVESLRSLNEEFWKREAAVYLLGLKSTSWVWRATDPDEVFSEMFPVETRPDGSALRWVRSSGLIETTATINRAIPLQFHLETAHFATPEMAATLTLQIDGREVPWSFKSKTRWIASVPDSPCGTKLTFRLSIDKSLIPQGKDISFAIREIRIESAERIGDEPLHQSSSTSDKTQVSQPFVAHVNDSISVTARLGANLPEALMLKSQAH